MTEGGLKTGACFKMLIIGTSNHVAVKIEEGHTFAALKDGSTIHFLATTVLQINGIPWNIKLYSN